MKASIYDDFFQAAKMMPEGQGAAFIYGICSYCLEGVEPDKSEPWYPFFILIKSRLDMGVKSSKAAEKAAKFRWGSHEESVEDGAFEEIAASEPHNAPCGSRIMRQTCAASEPHNAEYEYEYELKEKEKNKKEKEAPPTQSEKIRESKPPKDSARSKFQKPSIEEVRKYATEHGYSDFDAAQFIDYYDSNGWKVGRSAMKDWRAAVRNWARRKTNQNKSYSSTYTASSLGGAYIADYD